MSEDLKIWRDSRLNSISKSFCAAKWYNASLHLGHGYTNSCHLPLPHPIDLEEIKTNPSAPSVNPVVRPLKVGSKVPS